MQVVAALCTSLHYHMTVSVGMHWLGPSHSADTELTHTVFFSSDCTFDVFYMPKSSNKAKVRGDKVLFPSLDALLRYPEN